MTPRAFNCFGEDITAKKQKILASLKYGRYNEETKKIEPAWEGPNEYVDEEGFDKSYHGTHGYIDIIILLPGYKITRYNTPQGKTLADPETPYENRGLPFKIESVEYHEYIVTKPMFVKRGIIAPMFGSDGGDWQYVLFTSIEQAIRDGFLKEDLSWIKRRKLMKKSF